MCDSPLSGLIVAGDFEEIYGSETQPDEPQSGQWDAIMTCFFIDTVRNLRFHPQLFTALSLRRLKTLSITFG